MDIDLILKSDVLDILFENRNKSYGAYVLRKFYNNRLIQSIWVMLAAVTVFSAFTFLPETSKPAGFVVTEQRFGMVPPLPKIPETKPKLNRQPAITPLSTIKSVSKIIIVNSMDTVDFLHDLNNLAIGSSTNLLSNTMDNQSTGQSGPLKEGASEPAKTAEPSVDVEKPIDNPEVMPQYPGGMEALRKFLVRNLSNPRDLEEGELISVKIKFVVGYDGKLQRFELLQDGGSEFNNEVIRVLKKMPAWLPGKSKGQNVPVYYTIPVKFIREG